MPAPQGVVPLELGSLPHLQDAVAVVGYPIGGDTISVTSGAPYTLYSIPIPCTPSAAAPSASPPYPLYPIPYILYRRRPPACLPEADSTAVCLQPMEILSRLASSYPYTLCPCAGTCGALIDGSTDLSWSWTTEQASGLRCMCAASLPDKCCKEPVGGAGSQRQQAAGL